MKKFNKILLLFILGFFFSFIGSKNVYAVGNGISFDNNEYFNFYYEQKNNTSFYQFLISKGISLIDDYKSFYSSGNSIYITYFSKLPETIKSNFNSNVQNNGKYVTIFTDRPLTYSYDTSTGLYTAFLAKEYSNMYFSVYDSSSNLLGSYFMNGGSLKITLGVSDSSNFSYILSSSWYSTRSLNNDTYTNIPNPIYIEKFELENAIYHFDDFSVRWFGANWWYNLTKNNQEDTGKYGLTYFKINYVYKSSNRRILPLYDILLYNTSPSYTVPDGYNTATFSYDESYYLIPNSLTCTRSEQYIFFTTTNINSINILLYNSLNNNMVNNDTSKYEFSLEKANYVFALDLVNVIATDTKITDNIYNFSSSDNISTNNLYYNPDCYSAYIGGRDTITFTNVNTSDTVILDKNTQAIQKAEANAKADELVSNVDLNLSSLIEKGWNSSKNFISAGITIITLSTSLFDSLPIEVSSFLLLSFTIVGIVLVIKIIKSFI